MYSFDRFSEGVRSTGVAEEPDEYCTGVGVPKADQAFSTPVNGSRGDTQAQADTVIVDVQRLGTRLRRRARRISRQTASFIDDLARFDEHQGWRREGATSCSHWLSWRCDLGDVAAREHVRVARTLKKLPKIRTSFRRGQLSFSKVRAITRVANSANEDELIDMASGSSACELERRVRRYRDDRSAEAAHDEQTREQWQHDNRYLSHRWQEDGCLHVHARLTAEQGALFLKALHAGEETIGFERYDDSQELPPSQKGDADSASSTMAGDLPTRRPSQRRADVLCLMAEQLLGGGNNGRSGDRYQVVVNVDLETLANEPNAADKPSGTCELEPGPAIGAETARRLSCDASLVHMLTSEGEPLAIGRKSPVIPGSMRRALLFRDEHHCAFPGCSATHGLQGHHVQHWAQGGKTDLDNLVSLCPFHHRLLHEGGFSVEPNPEWCKPALRKPMDSGNGDMAVQTADSPVPRFQFSDRNGLAIGVGWSGEPWDLSRL